MSAGWQDAARTPRPAGIVPAAILAAALFAASYPYLEGWELRPAGGWFWAVPPVNAGDANQYLAFLRMAAQGDLLFHNPFTLQPHAARLFVPLSLAEGALARLAGLNPLQAYQISRVLCGAALLASAFWFGSLFLKGNRVRLLFVLLLGFSAGLGGVLDLAGIDLASGDRIQPEGNSFFTLGNLPHLAASQAALLLLAGGPLLLMRGITPPRLLLIAACSAFLSWEHPFDFIPLGAATAAPALLDLARGRRRRVWLAYGAAVAAAALPAATYYVWLLQTDPFYRSLASDTLRRHGFFFYAAAHLPLLLTALASLGSRAALRRRLIPICWIAGVMLILLLPLPLGGKQVRVLTGIHVPLCVLAAAGLDRLFAGGSRWRRLAGGLLLLLLLSGSWGIFSRHRRQYRTTDYFYPPLELRRTLEELGRRAGKEDRLIGGPLTGGWAPTWAPVRTLEGHWHLTPRRAERRREARELLLGMLPEEEERRRLRALQVRWVLWWAEEWGLPRQTPTRLRAGRIAARHGNIVLIEITPPDPSISGESGH